MPPRCHWARGEPEIAYHDREWAVPLYADRRLFELLILEGAGEQKLLEVEPPPDLD